MSGLSPKGPEGPELHTHQAPASADSVQQVPLYHPKTLIVTIRCIPLHCRGFGALMTRALPSSLGWTTQFMQTLTHATDNHVPLPTSVSRVRTLVLVHLSRWLSRPPFSVGRLPASRIRLRHHLQPCRHCAGLGKSPHPETNTKT